jgi:hypothetical protein
MSCHLNFMRDLRPIKERVGEAGVLGLQQPVKFFDETCKAA